MSKTFVVELDKTLLKTSLLFELCLKFLKKDAIKFLKRFVSCLFQEGDNLEKFLLENVELDAGELPYNQWLKGVLVQKKEEGCRLILTSEYNVEVVKEISEHFSIFDGVVANENSAGQNGEDKILHLRKIIGEESDFDYIGRKNGNRAIRQQARASHFVSDQFRSLKHNTSEASINQSYKRKTNTFFSILKGLRIHQWVKNILVFVPLLLAHEWSDPEKISFGLFAFLSFSLVASSVYVINDLWDINADRQHPYKKNRPFASGDLSIPAGLMISPVVFAAGIALSWIYVSIEFTGVLLLYWTLTTSYTFYLKRKVLLDVLILAGLYTIRLYGGAVATGVIITEWLMGFSLFFFLSLALIKRYTELSEEDLAEEDISSSRGYIKDDLSLLMSVGVSSGLMSVLIFALYINSEDVVELYSNHRLLWLVVPVLLYWIIRIWKLAKRGFMHDDPVVFAVRDRISLISGVLIIGIIMLSIYL